MLERQLSRTACLTKSLNIFFFKRHFYITAKKIRMQLNEFTHLNFFQKIFFFSSSKENFALTNSSLIWKEIKNKNYKLIKIPTSLLCCFSFISWRILFQEKKTLNSFFALTAFNYYGAKKNILTFWDKSLEWFCYKGAALAWTSLYHYTLSL